MITAKKVIVILADGFEELEAVAVIDILRRAEIDVVVCGLDRDTPTGRSGTRIRVDTLLDNFKDAADAIVLPGGMRGAQNMAASKRLNELLKKMDAEKKLVAAICASPAIVLAPAGVLAGKKATCYPEMEDAFGKDTKFSEEAVVVDGNIITSRGPATAIPFALAIVEKLKGKGAADNIRKDILA